MLTDYERWRFDLDTARQALYDQFEVVSLDGFGLAGLPLAIQAAGALVQYLAETQRSQLAQLSTVHTYSTEEYMTLDAATRRNLELTETLRRGAVQGSLLGVLDGTVTGMGGRLLRRWITHPLLDLGRVDRRLDAVEAFYRDTPARTRLRGLLKDVADLERLASRMVQAIARPRDLLGIRQSLEIAPEVQALTEQMDTASEAIRSLASWTLAGTSWRCSTRRWWTTRPPR